MTNTFQQQNCLSKKYVSVFGLKIIFIFDEKNMTSSAPKFVRFTTYVKDIFVFNIDFIGKHIYRHIVVILQVISWFHTSRNGCLISKRTLLYAFYKVTDIFCKREYLKRIIIWRCNICFPHQDKIRGAKSIIKRSTYIAKNVASKTGQVA